MGGDGAHRHHVNEFGVPVPGPCCSLHIVTRARALMRAHFEMWITPESTLSAGVQVLDQLGVAGLRIEGRRQVAVEGYHGWR